MSLSMMTLAVTIIINLCIKTFRDRFELANKDMKYQCVPEYVVSPVERRSDSLSASTPIGIGRSAWEETTYYAPGHNNREGPEVDEEA